MSGPDITGRTDQRAYWPEGSQPQREIVRYDSPEIHPVTEVATAAGKGVLWTLFVLFAIFIGLPLAIFLLVFAWPLVIVGLLIGVIVAIVRKH